MVYNLQRDVRTPKTLYGLLVTSLPVLKRLTKRHKIKCPKLRQTYELYTVCKTKQEWRLKAQVFESVVAEVSKKNTAFIFRANQSIILLLNCMTSKWGTERLRNARKYAVYIPEHLTLQQHD